MPATTLEPAYIKNIDKTSPELKCLFNPNKYVLRKSNTWTESKRSGHDLPRLEFGGGQPATLEMELLFDTYAAWTQGKGEEDVRRYTDRLWDMARVSEKLKDKKNKRGRPPYVHFQWGHAWFFDGVITSVSQDFTLFFPSGTPARATCQVTMQEAKDASQLPAQNPTSGGGALERVWTVLEGDTLALIAHREYGDPTRWRPIADANRLSRVRGLVPGTQLLVPHDL